MRVVHMDSGLGNQMLDYAEYLAICSQNQDEKCYLENLIYELPFKDGMFSMWNGYELGRIFGINPPNIKEKFIDKISGFKDKLFKRNKDYLENDE